jgi:periplasmic protein TonB
MATLVSQSTALPRLNWPRIGAFSGSISLHLYIVLLLFTPAAALQLLRPADPPPTVVDILNKIPEVVQQIPDLPKPLKHQTHPVIPHPAPIEQKPEVPITVGASKPTPPAVPGPANVDSRAETHMDVAPTALAYATRTRVDYPIEARRRREQGTVVLRVLVGVDGVPQIVEIESSSGSSRLDTAARNAVRNWSFRPGTRDGVAQSAWARIPIAFDLSQL